MKFSHQLKFNSVADWKEHYVHYAALKKIIYEIARLEQLLPAGEQDHDHEQALSEPLLQRSGSGRLVGLPIRDQLRAKEEELVRELDKELAGIIAFYMRKEAEVLSKLEALDLEVHSLEKLERSTPPTLDTLLEEGDAPSVTGVASITGSAIGAGFRSSYGGTASGGGPQLPVLAEAGGVTSGVLDAGSRPASIDLGMAAEGLPKHPEGLRRTTSQPWTRSQRVRFWQDVAHRREMRELRGERDSVRHKFMDVYTTLSDLIEFLHLNREGFRKVIKKHDKLTSTCLRDTYWPLIEAKYPSKKKEDLERCLELCAELYAQVFTGGDVSRAKDTLSRNLREHIKVERTTVWRDMVAMERRTVAATVEAPAKKRAWWITRHWDAIFLLLSLTVFGILLSVDIFPDEPWKRNCLAILVLSSMLWATEALPLFATAMLIPVLVVVLRVLVEQKDGQLPTRLTPQQAAPAIFHAMFSQVIMLLLGGFTIAAALSKHFIAKQMAVAVLSRVGRKPSAVLLASMFVATFASMWISNVAAPVLCFSLVQPILRTMDTHTPFAKSLVMGIALASNVGGMTSPISSPQNIFASERMSADGHPPSWLAWFAVALPVACVCNLVCWGMLLLVYRPWVKTTEVRPLKPNNDPWNPTQVYVIVVSIITVGLWCANTMLQKVTGEMGVVAVLPMIAFFGFGVLSKDDFNGFLWNVVMLAMGGSALGEAVKSSGLLETIANDISELVHGLDLWSVAAIFCGVVLVCTTFISHTVGAMVILPIVQSVGDHMADPHPKLLVMAAALMCSGAMGLPVSGFPNMNAVSLEDSTGQTYVSTLDFLMTGIPSSIGAWAIIVSLGYGIMHLLGF